MTPSLLNAIHLATRKLASSRKLNDVLPEVLSICVEAVGAEGGTIYLHNRSKSTLEFRHVLPESSRAVLQFSDIPEDHGVAGRVFQSRCTEVTQFEEVTEPSNSIANKAGMSVRTMITIPLMLEDTEPIGVVQLINKHGGPFDENDRTVLETVSAVSTLAYLNWQLVEERARVSQLEGMGRVAHDIKNMAFALEANLSFSHDTMATLQSYAAKEDCDPNMAMHLDSLGIMIDELHGSIDRIKRYSMLMSDLSVGKRLQPEMRVQPMGETIKLAAAYLESEGRKHDIQLEYEIDDHAPAVAHDEMYVFRIVQNLVSNAIKAVAETKDSDPDGHECVRVCYRFDGSHHLLEIVDTGPGMTPEVAERILSGSARSVWNKSSGSGWGTKIVLELAATHSATVSIESTLGVGSTFRVSFPA